MTTTTNQANSEQTQRFSYDEVPYEGSTFPQTTPSRMASVARVLGLTPPPVETARVLELGCASGRNLIPLAARSPNSEFIGIDLSGRQVSDGQNTINALGLKNVELRRMGIEEVTEAMGKFDYIICHGVFSWVPEAVREKILDVCVNNLSPDGVAYVSYNTYPGWGVKRVIREMMQFRARRFPTPKQRVHNAKALLDWLAANVANNQGAYRDLLKEESEMLKKRTDSYVLHEHLEDENVPMYFHEFAHMAEAKNLQYLGEAQFSAMGTAGVSEEIEKQIRSISRDLIEYEQLLDFLRNRKFRQTLLVHAGKKPSRALNSDRLAGLHVACPLKPASSMIDLSPEVSQEFLGQGDLKLSTKDVSLKSAMYHLAEAWPNSVLFEDLVAHVANETGDKNAEKSIGSRLLKYYLYNMVEFHATPIGCFTKVSEHPKADYLSLRQSRGGPVATNLRHETITLQVIPRNVLALLDGERTKVDVVKALKQMHAAGQITIKRQGGSGDIPLDRVMEKLADQAIDLLAKNALLVS